jgi:hypothetical protein
MHLPVEKGVELRVASREFGYMVTIALDLQDAIKQHLSWYETNKMEGLPTYKSITK